MIASNRPYRRYLLALCGGLLVFLGARWAFQQDKRDRLREIPATGAELFDIEDGTAYFSIKEARGPRLVTRTSRSGQSFPDMLPTLEPLVIQSMPVAGGPARPVGEHRLQNIVFRRIQITDHILYYITYSETQSRPVTWPLAIPDAQRKVQAGLFLARASLHALPLTGGAPRELLPGKEFAIGPETQDGEPICVVGDKVYWIEIDPEKRPHNTCASLKVAKKNGGEPQTLMTNLSPQASLVAEQGPEETVWIITPSVEEYSSVRQIFRLRRGEEKPQLFHWSKERRVQISRPITLDGRVYWKRDIASEPGTDHQAEILSAAPDGSDMRIEYAFSTSASIPSQLYQHAGNIYFEIYQGKESAGANYGNILMRLTPGSPPVVRQIFHFPLMVSQFFFDGDFLYYTQEEERGQIRTEGSQGSFPVFARVLRRYPLPQ